MGEEAKLYDIINKVGKVHIDDIIEETGMKTQAVTSILMQLEINGFIKQTAGKYYTIVIQNKKLKQDKKLWKLKKK